MDTSSEVEAPANPRLHAMAAMDSQEDKGLFIFEAGPLKREEAGMLQGQIIDSRVVDYCRYEHSLRDLLMEAIHVARASRCIYLLDSSSKYLKRNTIFEAMNL